MTAWSSEELRRAALEGLGEHADERARDALLHASIGIVEAAAVWDGSSGRVSGHRVTLAVDARMLGRLRAVPALGDALCAAVAATMASRAGEALLDLRFLWRPGTRASAHGYRDAPPSTAEGSLRCALTDYLGGLGEDALARSLGDFDVETMPGADLTLRVDPRVCERLRSDAHALAGLTAALRDLIGDETAGVRVR